MHIRQIRRILHLNIERSLKKIPRETLTKNPPAAVRIELEPPKDLKHGDLATNVAMRMVKDFPFSAIKLAGLIKDELAGSAKSGPLAHVIQKIEVSPPGFINFRFKKEYLYSLLLDARKEKHAFGKNTSGKGRKVNIEFVSANPTGPLTVAHGRQAAVGDAIGRILEFSGYKVCREYFINDVGNQITLLGKSIYSHYASLFGLNREFPMDGYRGDYIKKIAEGINEKYEKKFVEDTACNLEFISEYGVQSIMGSIKEDLKNFGISFNKWFSQRALSSGKVKDALERLKTAGYVYEKDGATWFRSKAFGDEKDRVVIKTGGAFTYLAPDIAYHLNKYKRKFDKLIDIWGPDHHGYIPRLKAAMEALGYDKKSLSIRIVQLATLLRNGVVLSMSTRKGEFISLRQVIDEVGCDVAKFFFLMRKLDSHLDFDLELAKKNSLDNPVYYIQYAHARISSIFGFSKKLGAGLQGAGYDANLLVQPEEIGLLKMLCQFPVVVESAARALEPYKLIEFLNDFAKAFHRFYTKHRVVLESDLALTKARLALVGAVKVVLANGLYLLGISFPEHM